ncbi:MAG: polysaccharide biosynthesis tyrosine autokinase [Candidatus Omnitrophica bacterium]|nr:polysaccharide biosynthesis tyrosine autokinase [Candidatus Omnitrophota bacterium]
MIPSPEVKELTLKDYVDILLRRVWILMLFLVVIPSIVAIRDLRMEKVYEVETKILLKSEMPQISGKEGLLYRQGMPAKEDQVNLLQSRALAERVIKTLNLSSEEEFSGASDPARSLLERVTVEQEDQRRSNVVWLRVEGSDPLKITNIANTWAQEFIELDVEQRISTAKYGVAWLKEQLDQTLQNLQAAEKNLNAFIKKNKIVAIPDVGEQKETLIERLKEQKVDLEKELFEMSKKYKLNHPDMLALRSQLEAVEKSLAKEKKAVFELQEKSLEYRILKRNVAAHKSLYDDFLRRINELEVTKEMVNSNIMVVEEAHIPSVPIRPRFASDMVKAILISLALGAGLCYFLEYTDTSLKTSEDVEFYTRLPFLGYVPSAKKGGKRGDPSVLISSAEPYSQVAEALRNLRVSLIFSFPEDHPLRSVMVTSAVPREGKSFIAANLAVIFAQANEETLLIETDMRKGKLSKIFEIDAKHGLSSVLAGLCPLEDAVSPTSIPHLSVMLAGPYTPNPAELLSSHKLVEIMEEAKKKYKRIVVDAPPVLGVADTVLVGDKCDGVVFVVKTASTSLKLVEEAKKMITDKMKVIGATLNNVEMERDRYYYYHYYSYAPEKKG